MTGQKPGVQERHLMANVAGLDSFEAALTWILNTLDAEFAGATRLVVNIHQEFPDETTGTCNWGASVNGCTRNDTELNR